MAPGDAEQLWTDAVYHHIRCMLFTLALGIGLERRKYDGAVRSAATEAEARHGKGSLDLRDLGQNVRNLFANVLGVFERSSRGSLHCDHEIFLVFVGHKAFGYALENPIGKTEAGKKQHDRNPSVLQKPAQQMTVAVRDRGNRFVHLLEEPALLATLVAQQKGGE